MTETRTRKSVAVVVPVHNRVNLTRVCLDALTGQTYKDFFVVVVDDGSTDGTAEMIRNQFADVEVIQGDGNLWWSGAMNLGVSRALERGASYVLSLNDDTVPGLTLLEDLVCVAEQIDRSLVCAGTQDIVTRADVYVGERVDWRRASVTPPESVEVLRSGHRVSMCDRLPGRGLLIPVAAFGVAGGFDATVFPQTGADYHFTQSLARSGWQLVCCRSTELLVHEGENSGNRFRRKHSFRNFWNHLMNRRGAGNLRVFIAYAVRDCPRRHLVPFLFMGVAKRVGGYVREWVQERGSHK